MLTKSELRQEIRLQKRGRSLFELAEESALITQRVVNHPKVAAAKVVMLYHALPDEVDTHGMIERLRAMGKTILLPKVTDSERMELRLYRGEEDLEEGAFHIMEPSGPVYEDLASIDVALVPGMSFDSENNRLGRGKGYYDRFLGKITNTYKIGICYGFQKRTHIPADDFDVRMDEII